MMFELTPQGNKEIFGINGWELIFPIASRLYRLNREKRVPFQSQPTCWAYNRLQEAKQSVQTER